MTRPTTPAGAPRINLRVEGDLLQWLDRADGTLLVTTYNSGKLVAVSVVEGVLATRVFRLVRPMGLAVRGSHLAVAVRREILAFCREGPPEVAEPADGQVCYRLEDRFATGGLDSHDLAFGSRGIYFVNTRFNCLARPSDRVNFLRNWQPPFIDRMIGRDCCHLNGLAMRSGRPAMATAFCQGSEPRSWKDGNRFTSGVLIDVVANQVVADGLCMPHSPRRYDRAWWLCDSGRGLLCRWDERSGRSETIAQLPGFTRGLGFAAGRALVGLSKIRDKHILDAPPIRHRCPQPVAGVALVDVVSGATTGLLDFVEGGNEVYEVAFLPGVRDLRIETPPPEPSGA